jgi:hypothetical protein
MARFDPTWTIQSTVVTIFATRFLTVALYRGLTVLLTLQGTVVTIFTTRFFYGSSISGFDCTFNPSRNSGYYYIYHPIFYGSSISGFDCTFNPSKNSGYYMYHPIFDGSSISGFDCTFNPSRNSGYYIYHPIFDGSSISGFDCTFNPSENSGYYMHHLIFGVKVCYILSTRCVYVLQWFAQQTAPISLNSIKARASAPFYQHHSNLVFVMLITFNRAN